MDIVLGILVTAIAYMAFPLIKLLTHGGRFPKIELIRSLCGILSF